MSSWINIAGLDDQQKANLLNARNYDYFRDMIRLARQGKCAFCTIDPEINKVTHENENWRMWHCPPKFLAKDVSEHIVIAPKQHEQEFGHLDSIEHSDFVSLFLNEILPGLSGPIPQINLGEKFPMLRPYIHGEYVTPDLSERIQASFGFDNEFIDRDVSWEEGDTIKEHAQWSCQKFPVIPGLENRYIFDWRSKFDNKEPDRQDFQDLFSLLSFLVEAEVGANAGPGTFLLALPGAALSMRCGDIRYTAASQTHLHANVKRPKTIPGTVSETLGKDPKDIEEKKKVVISWEAMRLWQEVHAGATYEEAFDAALSPEQKELLNSRK